jgi:hypothetical protein
MNLTDAQRQQISAWIQEGLKLSDLQKRIASELGLSLTYMQVRFLLDDLQLKPKDIEPPKPAPASPLAAAPAKGAAVPADKPAAAPAPLTPAAQAPKAGAVSVTVDQLTRAGAMVSGKVNFSDGQTAEWYLDQTGRLGLVPKQQGYRPSQEDVMSFQTALQNELARLGF